MSHQQRIRIGCTASNTGGTEWHQKIRDILDIHRPNESCVKKKDGRVHRRTICCDRYRDESTATASLSCSNNSAKPDPISFCDVTPTSPSREHLQQKSHSRSPSPIRRQNAEHMGIVLAKHRINSPADSAMFGDNLSPSIKSRSNSPFSKRCDLPVVPFSPTSDYGSFDEKQCSAGGSNVPDDCAVSVHDDCLSPVTNYEGSEDDTGDASFPILFKNACFQGRPNGTHPHHNDTHKDLKPQANAPRRSSCNGYSSFSDKFLKNTSTNKPFYYTSKRLSLNESRRNDTVLNLPNPKGNVSRYSIRVHRGSIGDEPDISLPFNTIPSSKTSRRASEKVDFVSTQRKGGHVKRRTTDTDIPREIIMIHCHEKKRHVEEKQRQRRRASNYTPMTGEKQRQRRRASDYDANERYDKSSRNRKEIKNYGKPKSYSIGLVKPV